VPPSVCLRRYNGHTDSDALSSMVCIAWGRPGSGPETAIAQPLTGSFSRELAFPPSRFSTPLFQNFVRRAGQSHLIAAPPGRLVPVSLSL
jgi:hypothetical protein